MIELLLYLAVSLSINIAMFIPAFLLRTDKLTDMSYSLTFIIIILLALFSNNPGTNSMILALMIMIWSLRLGLYLVIRIHGMKKDSRFDSIRGSFLSFLKFWLLQGLAVFIILLPSLLYMTSPNEKVFWPGALLWLLGLLLESIADSQKYIHKKKSNSFISSGLWKYSRHPNYFGEILCWTGIYVFVLPSLTILEALIGIISPLFIAIILVFVTGIPPLERAADNKWKDNKDYASYKKNTSILVPWIPKKE